MINEDDVLAAAPSLHLTMHQQDVIHAFLYRVCDIGDDVHKCTPCLERYHGMTFHVTLCTGCHNEVLSPLSLVRALTDIHMLTVHRTANIATNYADPGEITPGLHNIIDGITQMEMLRCGSLASPCFDMWGKQKWAMLSLPLHTDSRGRLSPMSMIPIPALAYTSLRADQLQPGSSILQA